MVGQFCQTFLLVGWVTPSGTMVFGFWFDLLILNVFKIAASPRPGWVTVRLKSQAGVTLGETKILYIDEGIESVQRVLHEEELQKRFFEEFASKLGGKTGSGETQTSGDPGMLSL